MSIIYDIVVNIITDKIICPLIVVAGIIAGVFFSCKFLGINVVTDILKPTMEFIMKYFSAAISSLKGVI